MKNVKCYIFMFSTCDFKLATRYLVVCTSTSQVLAALVSVPLPRLPIRLAIKFLAPTSKTQTIFTIFATMA